MPMTIVKGFAGRSRHEVTRHLSVELGAASHAHSLVVRRDQLGRVCVSTPVHREHAFAERQ